ncbi:MAG: sugar phosphate isomerase/epimerase [Chloroflexi bacterium]|nr:sugar phosphate isomerase/epimerase [Chloroflexota bacterium]
MKLSMLTGLWYVASKATVFEALERAAALGFRTVDLHGVFHAGPAHLTPDERRLLRRELDRLGLEARNYVLHARHNIPGATPTEREEDLAYLREGLECASSWGVRQLMLNAGQWTVGVGRADAWRRAAAFLQRVCEEAEPRGIYILQEPEPYVWFLVDDLAAAQQMQQDVARPNFGLLADLGHMGLARESAADLEPLSGAILHAHFSDHEANRHTNEVIGGGAVPTRDLLAGLRRMQLDARLQAQGFDELAIAFELGVPGDDIADPDDWVRRSIAAVQTLDPGLGLR